MRFTWKHGSRSFELERQPMPPDRFAALCKLAGAVIGGGVLLALVQRLREIRKGEMDDAKNY